MLHFLVKLANLFDERQQFEMAREVDDLITKLAQARIVDDPSTDPVLAKKFDEMNPGLADPKYVESLSSILSKIVLMAQEQAVDTSPDAAESASQMFQAVNDASGDPLEPDENGEVKNNQWNKLSKPVRDSVVKVLEGLEALSGNTNPANTMIETWEAVANAAKVAGNAITQGGQAGRVKKRPNLLVLEAQKLLNAKQTGTWDIPTNKAFLAAMQQHYPNYLKDGKFQGDLKLAVQLLRNISGLDLLDKTKTQKQPEQATKSWKSRNFQITPAAQQSLQKIEQVWPGTSQQEIDTLDKQKETGTVGKHMDQETFEEMLAGRAVPKK